MTKVRQQMDLEYDALAADAVTLPGDNALKSVAHVAAKMRTLEGQIQGLERALKQHKEEHRSLQEQVLPDMMTEIGLAEFVMADGATVKVQTVVDCSLSKKRAVEGCDWLAANGHGGAVTTELVLKFPKGNEAAVQRVVAHLAAIKIHVAPEHKIHAQTLKKLYRELVEQGQDLPEQLFNTYHGRKAVVKEPK